MKPRSAEVEFGVSKMGSLGSRDYALTVADLDMPQNQCRSAKKQLKSRYI